LSVRVDCQIKHRGMNRPSPPVLAFTSSLEISSRAMDLPPGKFV
jgi:hypothetical protein